MAERKRGLGRGIGALIPDVVTDERPVDVFFPDAGRDAADEAKPAQRAARRDPSEGMRRAAAKKSAGKKAPRGAAQAKAAAQKDAEADAGAGAADGTASAVGGAGSGKRSGSSGGARGRTSGAGAGTQSGGASPAAKRGTAADKLVHEQQQAEAHPTADAGEPGGDSMDHSPELRSVPGTAFGMLPVGQIRANPRQPRTIFDEDALAELVHSIREVGVLQPIVVRVVDARQPQYELIMGERRFRASQEAGLSEIPAIIRDVRDDDLLRDALLENLHRADLNPLEEAAAYQQLLDDFSCTQEELSERIGRSRPQITNTLRLLRLPALVQRRVAAGVISQGHARAILGLNDSGQMEVLAQRVVAEGLSVRATEEAVVLLNRGEKPRAARASGQVSPELAEVARSIGDRLDTRVAITMGKRKGKISVEFANAEDLERILAAMGVQRSE